ncbi:DNA-directed DNA polymerase alpha [Scheffersomyces coipomensis]|uniref:DNA-directed DNA polymerase alpha n=1 Tax=Scheffersomyces coipomensis TaxID=1788519 RepID=UPI00315D0D68
MLLRASKREKLKQLREARKSGTSNFNVSDDEQEEIYDEVDEETYREHKRKQLMNDDFIVDDDGEGYVDNGVDEWDDSTRPKYYSDEDEDDSLSRKKRKHKQQQKPIKVSKTANISNFFRPSTTNNVAQVERKEANIDDILDDFQDEPIVKKQKRKNQFNVFSGNNGNAIKKKNKNTFNFSTATKKEKDTSRDDLDDYSMDMDDQPSSPVKVIDNDSQNSEKENIVPQDGKPSSPIKHENNKSDVEDEVEDDSEDDSEDDIVVTRRPRAAAVLGRNNRATFSSVKAKDIQSSSPLRHADTSFVNHNEKLDKEIVMKESESNSFKMFWLDYSEVDGTLLLFGKVLVSEGKYASAVVQVNGLCREIYFLPRKYRLVDGEEDKEDEITPEDVHEEIVPLLIEKYGLEQLRARPEKMKYAFELPDVPKTETEYLKVLLPFRTKKNRTVVMPSELEGQTFKRAFGTNSNIFEAFVLQQNIMGPCWLEISNGDFNAIQNSSHCQIEVAVGAPKFVNPITEGKIPEPPNLTITSIAVQTCMNSKQNKQEIVSVSLATYQNVPQDAPIEESLQPDSTMTLVRPIGTSANIPPGLLQLAQKQNINVKTFPNEKVLLNFLAGYVKTVDPDVFVGHRLENISLDVLVQRMHDLQVYTWSTFGRRNRKSWPDRFNKSSFNNNLLIREVFQGRLLCDVANELGQSLTPKCQSWEIAEMYDVVCHKEVNPMEINFSNPKFSEDASFLMMALKENFTNVKITAEIAFSIQILSLSKQLTNIAGNAWSHTLSGTRAGRNEFILLHEFKRNNYIVPDKEDKYHKNSTQVKMIESTEDDATTATSNKKPKYQGGLVFEPEKGLHKNFVLVMDFNSLYPSIIQEFNICFTTIERDQFNVTHDEDRDMPVIPERDSTAGVLPRLLSTLVNRRREVKKLLKDPKNTPFQKAQFDIKQQALKLTANSMYGCLGYVLSRFYAKPLAMLVTNKGREILMDTRQLAESIGLRVVYGDTDSVMIDTGVDNFNEALKIGEEFKLKVNERYRLLEIDIDNVFKRLLLHAKKKYAAMNATINKTTGEVNTTLEVKGLDMRRREYCQLSKDISTFVLMKILSDLDPEQALGEVYDYLEEMTGKIKNRDIGAEKFRINTKLSKDPGSYPNGKSMPQVQVALRLRNEGKVIKAGAVITYIITDSGKQDENSTPAERARAIQEVFSKGSNLYPDAEYYLEKQIFAPVERLLERIEGVDMMRVAKCLGIDTKKYVLRVRNNEGQSGEIMPLESSISDAERFNNSSFLVLKCKCDKQFRFGGIQASHDYNVTFNGVTCSSCQYTFPILKLTSQLERTIRQHISLYYNGWLVCDDAACGITTRQISVYGKRCIGTSGKAYGCKGIMRFKYTDKALYNQLLYFNSLFDVDKTKKNELRPIYNFDDKNLPTKLPSGQVDALSEQNRETFSACQEVVNKYLDDCGRRYVNMRSIFDFMT